MAHVFNPFPDQRKCAERLGKLDRKTEGVIIYYTLIVPTPQLAIVIVPGGK